MRRSLMAGFVVTAFMGCGKKPAASDAGEMAAAVDAATARETAVAPSTPALRGRPKAQAELPTTAGRIFVDNLDGQIEATERVLKVDPKSPIKIANVGAAHYAHGKFLGDLDEIAA